MGQRFGRYELKQRIAHGGMAEVFEAERLGASGFTKEVIIKRILPSFRDELDFIQMFIREACISALLSHPNIVQTIDFDEVDDSYYIAMEKIEGCSLKELIEQVHAQGKRLPIEVTVQIMGQLLQGLSYAHELCEQGRHLGIVHRDISPHNIMLTRQGDVKLIDFGIARLMAEAGLTKEGVLKGKLSYMAPEQSVTSQVDARADLFAVGIIFWEMLTGERLFKASNDIVALCQLHDKEIVPPHLINPEVPEALSQIVMWALQRDLQHRAPSARALYQSLQQAFFNQQSKDRIAHFLQSINTQSAPKKVQAPVQQAEELEFVSLCEDFDSDKTAITPLPATISVQTPAPASSFTSEPTLQLRKRSSREHTLAMASLQA